MNIPQSAWGGVQEHYKERVDRTAVVIRVGHEGLYVYLVFLLKTSEYSTDVFKKWECENYIIKIKTKDPQRQVPSNLLIRKYDY